MNTHRKIYSTLVAMISFLQANAFAGEISISSVCADCVIEKVAECGGFLEGITTNSAGNIWVLDVTGDRILQVVSGKCVERGKTGSQPNGAKFRSNGKLLITAASGLLEFDPVTRKITNLTQGVGEQPIEGLNDLAIDAAGGLYFTAPGQSSIVHPNGRVYYWAPGAKEPQLFADGIAFPNGIAVGPSDETVLVSEFAGKRILTLPSATATGPIKLAYVYAHTAGGVGVDGITLDSRGRLYAANLGVPQILVFSPDSTLIGSIKLTNYHKVLVTNLTILSDYLYFTESYNGIIYRLKLLL